jgi:hypothetical protein
MSFIYVFGKCISELCLTSGLIFAGKPLSHGKEMLAQIFAAFIVAGLN